MSEYQYVAFRAIDKAVSQANLAYMRKQSSRAEITPWSFENEYEFGDFRGDAVGMLRRGYDFHLHYANFGTRMLMIRLPQGLPDAEAAKPYLEWEAFEFDEDRGGPGGTLCLCPSYEAGYLNEFYEFEGLIERLLPLRAEIIAGDLRPLYLARLAYLNDCDHGFDELEGPVPAGLDDLTNAQKGLAEFYDLSDALLQAAAEPLTGEVERRSLSELLDRAEAIAAEAKRKQAASAEQARQRMLKDLAADPDRALSQIEKLVAERKQQAYMKVAGLLADLRTALANGPRAGLAEAHAEQLRAAHPTLRTLTAALRKQGFLKK